MRGAGGSGSPSGSRFRPPSCLDGLALVVDEPADVVDRPAVNDKGQPVNAGGGLKRDPDGLPLPPAPRTKVCDQTASVYAIEAPFRAPGTGAAEEGSASSGTAAPTTTGGSTATPRFTGYCYGGRKVFCVTYYQTNIPHAERAAA